MHAFWKLGQLLEKVGRSQGLRTDLTSSRAGTKFRAFLPALDPPLDKNRAQERQRVGANDTAAITA